MHCAVDSTIWVAAIPITTLLRYDFDGSKMWGAGVALATSIAVTAQGVGGFLTGLYRRRWRYGSFDELTALAATIAVAGVIMTVVGLNATPIPRSVPPLATFFTITGAVAIRSIWRLYVDKRRRPSGGQPIVVIGAGDAGYQVVRTLLTDRSSQFCPVALLDDDPNKRNLRFQGVRVEGTLDELADVAQRFNARHALMAMSTAHSELISRMHRVAKQAGLKLLVLPRTEEMFGALTIGDIRPVSRDDLVSRHVADIDPLTIAAGVTGRRVLVTGAGGSLGSELCRQLQPYDPATLILLDRDEAALHATRLTLDQPGLDDSVELVLADVRDASRILEAFEQYRPDVVYHAAELGTVGVVQNAPAEAWKTNVLGTQNVLDAARRTGVERLVNISSDKASNPVGVVGWTERIAERLTTHAATTADGTFVSVRLGDVVGSRGSILATFAAQAQAGGPIVVTHPEATRFFMPVEEAARLTMFAGMLGSPGEALIPDMGDPVRIADVAERYAQQADPPLPITFSGLPPFEKLHAELFGDGETDSRPAHHLVSHVTVPPLSLRQISAGVNPDLIAIPMLALAAVHPSDEATTPQIFLSPPDVGSLERGYMLSALDSGWVSSVGPDLDAFEHEVAEKVGASHAVALSSGTAALHLALLAAGVGPGDDVLTSTATFVASANAIGYCGAQAGFIDSERRSWNISPQLLADELLARKRANRLPKAVVVVDLYGQCADFDRIMPLCRELGVTVVEDAAEALGATYKGRPAGTLADIGVFSFNGNKIITTSGGGMLVSSDQAIADRVRYLATQARLPVPHYEHVDVGFNYRLSNLLAAVGRAQLRRLPAMMSRRREINARYRELLTDAWGVSFMPVPEWSGWNNWLTCVLFEDADMATAVRTRLSQEGIESRPLWKPMHLQPLFANTTGRLDGTSEDLFRRGLCLPSGSTLTDRQVALIADLVSVSCEEQQMLRLLR